MARTVVEKGSNFWIYDDGSVRVDNVRCSYPHLHEAWAKNDVDPVSGKPTSRKFSVTGLADQSTHKEFMQAMVKLINRLLTEKKMGKIGSDKKFIRNGDDAGADEAEGQWIVATSETAKRRPSLRDRRGSQVSPEDAEEMFYPGCYINLFFKPWAQDNDYGKRVNASLIAVQFVRDGERFGEAPIDDEDVWDDNGDDDGMDGDDDEL